MPDGGPPIARSLARRRDHRRDQDELGHLDAGGNERCCKRAKRLSDHHEWSAELLHRFYDDVGMSTRACLGIIQGQPRGDASMATRLELVNGPPPDAGVDSGTWD